MKLTFHQKAIILNESGRFLALKAAYKGNKWDLPGGEVGTPELHYAALERELLEETGLKLARDVSPARVTPGSVYPPARHRAS